MAGTLGTIAGQLRIDVAQAIAAYARMRAENAATIFALSSMSRTLIALGGASLIAGAALTATFIKAVESAAQFEKKIDFFGAVTNASQADMKAVAEEALLMGKTTTFSAGQMADAFVEFGKAGVKTKDILGGVARSVVDLAQAADINLTKASDIIVSTMKTFRLGASQTEHIANVLAGAANASIIDVDDLGVSLKYVGGIASATGISLESTTAAIALLGNAGIKGSTAGTSLRQIIVSLNGNSKAATKELKALGIITKSNNNLFIDSAGHLKPLADIFQILQDHTAKLTDAQRLAALKTIFNNRALAAANILLRDGAKGFAGMNAEINKVKAADVAAKRLDNLAGDVTKLKNTIATLFIQAGTPFQAFFRQIVQGMTRVVKIFGNFSPLTQEIIFRVIGLTGAGFTLLGMFLIMAGVILKSIKVYKELRIALIALRATMLANVVAARAFTIALLTNPVFIIVAALIALVTVFILLYKHNQRFRDAMNAVGRALKAAFFIVLQFFKTLPGIFESVFHSVQRIWDSIYGTVSNAIKTTVTFVKNHWELIVIAILGPLGLIAVLVIKYWDNIYKAVTNAISTVINFVKTHWEIITFVVLGPLALILIFVIKFWSQLKSIFLAQLAIVVGIIKVNWAIVSAVFSVVFVVLSAIVRVGLAVIIDTVKVFWTILKAVWAISGALLIVILYGIFLLLKVTIVNAFNEIKTVVLLAWKVITAIFRTEMAIIGPIVSVVFNFIKTIITGSLNEARFVITTVISAIVAVFRVQFQVLKAISSAAWGAIKLFIIGPAQEASRIAIAAFRAIVSIVSPVFDAIRQGVDNGVNKVLKVVQGFKNKILAPLAGAATWLIGVGNDIVQGLIHGISALQHDVVNALLDLIPGPLKKFAGKLGIKSPSTVFMGYGRNITEGLILGITQGKTKVAAAAALLALEVSTKKHYDTAVKTLRLQGAAFIDALVLGIKSGKLSSATIESKIQTMLKQLTKVNQPAIQTGGLSSLLKLQNLQLEILVNQRAAVTTRLGKAQAVLTTLIASYHKVQSAVHDSIVGSFDITNQGQDTITGLLGFLQDKLQQAQNFAANIQNLIRKGVNKNIVEQLALVGPTDQTNASINALTQGTAQQIAQFNAMYASLGNTAASVGTSIAQSLYAAGISAAQGLVKGLQSQQSALTKIMNQVATNMINTIKKALGIHSPSRVFSSMGTNTLLGFIQGIESQLPALTKTMLNASKLAALDPREALLNKNRIRTFGDGGTQINNNYNITKQATVNNPPSLTTEDQILDSWKKLDALAGGASIYG